MTQVRDAVNPKPIRAELKNAAVLFFLEQRQAQRIPIEGHRLFICVARTFNRNIGSARKLRPLEFRNHGSSLARHGESDTGHPAPFPPGSVILFGSNVFLSFCSGRIAFFCPISLTLRTDFTISFSTCAW